MSRKPSKAETITLPADTLIHHMSDSPSEYGIRLSHPLLVNDKLPIRVSHVLELSSHEGDPKPRVLNENKLITNYFKDRPSLFTRLKKIDRAMKESRAVVVFDYSTLPHKYYYLKSKLSHIHEYNNLIATQFNSAIEVGIQKNQFMCFRLPTALPDLMQFRTTPNPMPTAKVDLWEDEDALGLLYIWNLLDEPTKFPREAASSITLAFYDADNVSQVNLGDLLEWAEKDVKITKNVLYKAWSSLMSTRTTVDSEALEGVEETPEEGGVVQENDFTEEPSESEELPKPVKEIAATTEDPVKQTETTVIDNEVVNFEVPVFEGDVNIAERTLNESMAELASVGRLSTAEQNRLRTISRNYKKIKNPFGEGTLEELTVIKPESLVISSEDHNIPEKKFVLDKGMLNSTVNDFTGKYVKELLQKDVTKAVLNVQNAGVLVKDYKVENKKDAINDYNEYTVELVPINGKASTVKFRLPVVNEDGEFLANNTLYKLDNQKNDLPIRKIRGDRVALTSYYGKVFIDRSPKAVNNYGRWITTKITKAAMDSDVSNITDLVFSNASLPNVSLPRAYTAVASNILKFTSGRFSMYFGYSNREEVFSKEALDLVESKGLTICGFQSDAKGIYLGMDKDGMIHVVSTKENKTIGNLSELIGLGWGDGPIEFAEVKVFGRSVPMVLFLAYIYGLSTLLSKTKIPHRWVDSGNQLNLGPHEYRFRFRNESLVIDTRARLASMIIGGLSAVKRITPDYDSFDFNKKGIYGHVFDMLGLGRHLLKEISLMDKMFVDPITKEILESRKEPTELRGMLVYAAELLLDDNAPHEMDPEWMRVRGYERFSGFVYNQLVSAIRTHGNAPNPARAQVSINPTAVWGDILADTAVLLVEESNPIHNLKEKEGLTFSGQGGRNSKTMVERTRVFHENDIGVISESTPDSAKVGIRSYMPPNAKLNSLRGTTVRFDLEKDSAASALSTTGLLSPSGTQLDGKRLNMSSVQQSSMVSAKGSVVTPVRTGYEQVIANRCSDKFAYSAKGDGKVISVDDKYLQIQYKDESGEEVIKGIPVGTKHGLAAGAVIPHKTVTDLKAGAKFKKGDILTWNNGYFSRDYLNPGGVSSKGGVLARMAILESSDTIEDSSAISERLVKQLATPISKMKTILVSFTDSVTNLVKEGDAVDIESILCVIEDASTAELSKNDTSLVGLTKLSGSTPRAKFRGTVGKVEIVYMGKPEDMHPTLKSIALKDAKARKETIKSTGVDGATTGEIFATTFVGGEKVTPNTMAITIYMDSELENAVGDKAVFDNALKTIVGRVMTGTNTTEDGEPIDGLFSYDGISRRIVPGAFSNGITNTTLLALGEAFVKAYRG
jgi:hypothetical protein